MSGEGGPRRFLLPTISLVLLFAALGPAIGGALFAPLAVILTPPAAARSLGWTGWMVTPFGHAIAFLGAYVVGIMPAAATGLVYALWDAVAPERAPRALVSAVIGGMMTYALVLRLGSLGASVEMTIEADTGAPTVEWVGAWSPGALSDALRQAFVACGAVAGLVCAFAANPLGLTTRQDRPTSGSALPGRGGA